MRQKYQTSCGVVVAKRFTDTKLYDQDWYLSLSPRLKCAWEWLCKRCDQLGIWSVSMKRLSFEVGEPVTLEELQEHFKVVMIGEDKLFIPGFAAFQYGDEAGRLSPKNPFHKSIAAKLDSLRLPVPEFKEEGCTPPPIPKGGDIYNDVPGAPQGRGISRGEGRGEEEGGVGETNAVPPSQVRASPLTRAQLDEAGNVWLDTLVRFNMGRANLLAEEQEALARMIQAKGLPAVKFALVGLRQQKATPTWNPADFVSLTFVFSPKNFQRLMNLGIQAHHKSAGAA
jgi:hypothetical protein